MEEPCSSLTFHVNSHLLPMPVSSKGAPEELTKDIWRWFPSSQKNAYCQSGLSLFSFLMKEMYPLYWNAFWWGRPCLHSSSWEWGCWLHLTCPHSWDWHSSKCFPCLNLVKFPRTPVQLGPQLLLLAKIISELHAWGESRRAWFPHRQEVNKWLLPHLHCGHSSQWTRHCSSLSNSNHRLQSLKSFCTWTVPEKAAIHFHLIKNKRRLGLQRGAVHMWWWYQGRGGPHLASHLVWGLEPELKPRWGLCPGPWALSWVLKWVSEKSMAGAGSQTHSPISEVLRRDIWPVVGGGSSHSEDSRSWKDRISSPGISQEQTLTVVVLLVICKYFLLETQFELQPAWCWGMCSGSEPE